MLIWVTFQIKTMFSESLQLKTLIPVFSGCKCFTNCKCGLRLNIFDSCVYGHIIVITCEYLFVGVCMQVRMFVFLS